MRAPGTAVGLLLFATLAACSGGADPSPTAPPAPPAPPPRDTLTILAIEPAAGTTITEGVARGVEARLAYHFARAARGRLGVVVLCSGNAILSCLDAGTLADLPTAEGEVEVQVFLRRPIGNSVRVRFGIAPEGSGVVTANAEVSYPIK